jgi:hypothetical protein
MTHDDITHSPASRKVGETLSQRRINFSFAHYGRAAIVGGASKNVATV